jgi:hypothetical protein
MSVYQTKRITRSKAKALAMERILRASDELLSTIMSDMLEERLYNCRIVPDGEENDEEELGL